MNTRLYVGNLSFNTNAEGVRTAFQEFGTVSDVHLVQDRETREPLDLIDEIEKGLALTAVPMVWPIGLGKAFAGTYDLTEPRIRKLDSAPEGEEVSGPDDARVTALLAPGADQHFRDEIELVHSVTQGFDRKGFLEGHLSPVYFGSAIKNFGVRDLLDALVAHAPAPRDQKASTRTVHATEPAMTGIVFKIQANMDPNHRDRIAFMRVCSGALTKGQRVKHVRSGKTMAITAPQFFFAQDRSIAEKAYAGDVVGIPNRGVLRIGDALTEGEDITFLGIPSFAPEILRKIRLEDAIKAKKLKDALKEMAEEGVVQLFQPIDGTQPVVGVIGALQLDVLADRLENEYGLATGFDMAGCEGVRWISADDPKALQKFIDKNRSQVATDLDGDYVILAPSTFSLGYTKDKNPDIHFKDIKAING